MLHAIKYWQSTNRFQIAIAKFFDGEAPDPLEEARAAQAAPSPVPSVRRETLLDGFPSNSRSPRQSAGEPAPRIVPRPQHRQAYKPPFLFSILLTPFNLLTRLVGGSFSLIGYMLSFLPRLLPGISSGTTSARSRPRRRPLDPRDTAARFAREFEEEYGSHNLRFVESGYAQAYDEAKKDLKFLLVVLLSPEHDDISTFVHETLLAPEVVTFINDPQNKIILWAGNVQDSEAYQVSTALNCSKFPFAALIVHTPQDSSTSMSTVARITGLHSPSTFNTKLRAGTSQHAEALERVRSTRSEQQATRNLRDEQNSAYERSLAQDRERARQRREAQAAQARAEQAIKAKIEAEERDAEKSAQWRIWRAQHIAAEPGPDVKDVTRISIRMRSGERIVRRFVGSAKMEELYAFVECYDILTSRDLDSSVAEPGDFAHQYRFRLVSPMPRVLYNLEDAGTINDRIGRSGNLIVEPINDEEDEDA